MLYEVITESRRYPRTMPRHLIIAVALSLALAAGAFVALRVGKPAVTEVALVLAQPTPVPASYNFV